MVDIPPEIVARTVAVYQEHFRDMQFTDELVISDWYSLFPDEFPDVFTRYKWPEDYPNEREPGVYLFFDSEMSLLYIGKSTPTLKSRIGCHITWTNYRSGLCKIIKKKKGKDWHTRPCYLKTLAVENSSEAQPLEKFLIDKLQPPENDKGIRRRV